MALTFMTITGGDLGVISTELERPLSEYLAV